MPHEKHCRDERNSLIFPHDNDVAAHSQTKTVIRVYSRGIAVGRVNFWKVLENR
jgi:hypothetical protein